jgi:hypothetical protein
MAETRNPDPASTHHSVGQEARHHLRVALWKAERNLVRNQELIDEQQERIIRQAEVHGAVSPHSERLLRLLEACQETFIERLIAIRCDLQPER